MKLQGQLRIVYRSTIAILLIYTFVFVGCVKNENVVNESSASSFESLLKQSIADKQIFPKAAQSDVLAQSQKINLFGKCYYYEDMSICKKILDSLQQECQYDSSGLSCALLGVAVLDRKDGSDTQDRLLALRYFIDGCKLQDSLSCLFMRKYYKQYGYESEAQAILDSVTNICKNGGAFECLLLSILYENDAEFSAEQKYIKEYRINACNKNLAIACGYFDSFSLPKKDYEKYQRKACNLGMLPACDALSESIELNIRTKHLRTYRIW
ncbi:sel1 repeat family protein [Helicobacter aurati]|uniref:Sel1 repeat family protein n=1 Tax=Helicobacter aurati TaxID=137778 RepID=A0A3D8J3W0_9HELI|nr:sel1 repeat family protein [Helicobacter aurati]RDU71544.1 sel1 repeat family protein [Helicobacter aurati]